MQINWRSWFTLGNILISAGDATQAIEPLKKAAILAPGEPAAPQSLGEAYGRQGKLAESDLPAPAIMDEEVEHLMAERAAAKKARDFARSDAIRTQLSDAGILVEDTKDGIRWKRK